ncbi:hypothetical protein BGZ96_009301 [Linnemannia gamsii]|uniref:Zinc/iron permease n=1 Tax=Linnemannia gamsii TaxID=64522 RepID=A0ABQ7JX50_9FUNG|nr:hypothetical protein BGZ96_009301 [Linnemannia gamsii]
MACHHRTSLPLHHSTNHPFINGDNNNNNNNNDDDDYNLRLHILGIFTILAASSLGVLTPLLATKLHSFQLPTLVLTLGRQFGTGVILATALIHMLPTAMSNLSSPCLGSFFAEDYPGIGGLLVLTSSLLMHWIEFMATEFNQVRVRDPVASVGTQVSSTVAVGHTGTGTGTGGGGGASGKLDPMDVVVSRCPGHTVTVTDELECHRDHGDQDLERVPLLPEHHSAATVMPFHQDRPNSIIDPQQDTHDRRTPSMTSTSSGFYGAISDMTHSRLSPPPLSPPPVSPQSHHHQPRRNLNHHHHHYHHHDHNQHLDQNAVLIHSHSLGLTLPSDAQKRISTYVLEAGVAAHSVIIGVTLGVATGSEFTGLLVALLFHQFFEGFALGARIADLDLERTSTHYFLALIFALTTPTGILLGIMISQYTYQSDSATTRLVVEGVLDAISTGILLYMGYVTLLAVEFNLNSELLRQTPRVKSWCFFALWSGAGVMAVLGLFA